MNEMQESELPTHLYRQVGSKTKTKYLAVRGLLSLCVVHRWNMSGGGAIQTTGWREPSQRRRTLRKAPNASLRSEE